MDRGAADPRAMSAPGRANGSGPNTFAGHGDGLSNLKEKNVLSCFSSLVGTVVVTAFLFACPATAWAQPAAEEEAVLAVVQQFFDSMTAADTAAARAVLMPDGQYYGVRQDPDSVFIKRRTHREYLENLAESTGVALERMWNPTVLIHGSIAAVWVPYDFHLDGDFHHCGVDLFSLVKTDFGWRIAGTVYTIEPSGCDPSPLGPVGAEAEK